MFCAMDLEKHEALNFFSGYAYGGRQIIVCEDRKVLEEITGRPEMIKDVDSPEVQEELKTYNLGCLMITSVEDWKKL